MIDKNVLDAVAEVLKLERAAMVKLVNLNREELSDQLKEQVEASDDRHADNKDAIQATLDKIQEARVDLVDFQQRSEVLIEELRVAITESDDQLIQLVKDSLEENFAVHDEVVDGKLSKYDGFQETVMKTLAEHLETITSGKDGERGLQGEQGESGADGSDGRDGEQGVPGAAGKDGSDGTDGADGQDGGDGEHGKDGDCGRNGYDGTDGKDGVDGVDGSKGDTGEQGVSGERGVDGLDKYTISPKFASKDMKLDKGEVVYSHGGLFQSTRKTNGCPADDPSSYKLIVDGIDEIRFNKEADSTSIDIILSSGEQFSMSVENGAKGDQGADGARGRKGVRGLQGVGIEDIIFQDKHLIISLTNGDVTKFKLPETEPKLVPGTLVQSRAPAKPAKHQMWLNDKTGELQGFNGKKWVKVK